MKIIFLRHGATPGNLEKRYIGITDEALSEPGKAELRAILNTEEFQKQVGPKGIRKVYVSPLIRCRETAELFFPKAEQVVVPELAEMNFGIFENKNYEEMKDFEPYNAWVRSQCEDPIPEGESKESFTDRVVQGFEKAIRSAVQEETMVFAVHGGTIMSVFSRFGEPHKAYYQWHCENGHGYIASWDGEKLKDIIEI